MQSRPVIRFGVFELDLRAGELRKHGLKIKLQDQPFQILVMLLEHPGQVVTREQLHQKLWPDGTFVDFEHGLNAAVQRLRQALGDTAENPRFVETLARRGYRFVAVDGISSGATATAQPSLPETREVMESSQLGNQSFEWPSSQRRWHRIIPLLALLLTLGGVGWWHFRRTATAPAPQMRVTPFTDFPGWKSSPTFSPDGKQVAFVWNGENRENADIYVKMVGAGGPVRLTTHPAADVDPAWSPDGRFIAFRRVFKDSCDVLVIPAIGGAERKLAKIVRSEEGYEFSGISWSPDGKFVAMVNHGIVAVSEQTGEKQILSSPDALFVDDHPAFSPDGRSIAFVRSRKPGDTFTALFVQALGPGATPLGSPRQMTPSVHHVFGLAWDPSDRSVWFSSQGMQEQGHELPRTGLWRISVFGGKPQPLAVFGQSVVRVAFTPKGDRLAFTRVPQIDHKIYEINLAGSAGRNDLPRTVISSTEDDYSPQVSPDGKRIALVSARSGSLEIWICTSDGASCSPVTAFGGPEVGSPKWSPDSRQIAFDSIKYGQWDIFVADLEKGATRRLTYGSSNEARPGWSVDGQWIYFASDRTGEWQVWKVPSGGGSAVQVTRKGGFEADEGPDGKFVYYAKRDSKGIWRVPVRGGEETPFLDKGAEAQWFLARKGIYLLERESVRGYMLRHIELFSFATRGISRVADLPATAAGVAYNPLIPALTVSPDGRRALFSQMDHAESEIMIVENFR